MTPALLRQSVKAAALADASIACLLLFHKLRKAAR